MTGVLHCVEYIVRIQIDGGNGTQYAAEFPGTLTLGLPVSSVAHQDRVADAGALRLVVNVPRLPQVARTMFVEVSSWNVMALRDFDVEEFLLARMSSESILCPPCGLPVLGEANAAYLHDTLADEKADEKKGRTQVLTACGQASSEHEAEETRVVDAPIHSNGAEENRVRVEGEQTVHGGEDGQLLLESRDLTLRMRYTLRACPWLTVDNHHLAEHMHVGILLVGVFLRGVSDELTLPALLSNVIEPLNGSVDVFVQTEPFNSGNSPTSSLLKEAETIRAIFIRLLGDRQVVAGPKRVCLLRLDKWYGDGRMSDVQGLNVLSSGIGPNPQTDPES